MKSFLGGLSLAVVMLVSGCVYGPPPPPPGGFHNGPPPGNWNHRRWIPGHFVYYRNGSRNWVPGHFQYW